MRLVLRPLVERDLDEATRWYEDRQPPGYFLSPLRG